MYIGSHQLDNPVWHSLSEAHKTFAVGSRSIKFYRPEYCPFGGAIEKDVAEGLAVYARTASNFYVVGEKPQFDNSIELVKELVCNQMLLEHKIDPIPGAPILRLNDGHQDQLFNLVQLVHPGFFNRNTAQMGAYFGIFQGDQLVAAAGERMKMNAYTEVSTVVTHPGHTGKGYATKLLAHVTGKIFNDNKLPYLHVAEANLSAIRLYDKLGFKTRRKISFWNFRRR